MNAGRAPSDHDGASATRHDEAEAAVAGVTLLDEARTSDGLTLTELAREIPGEVKVEGPSGTRVYGVQHDSRRVARGDLFVVRRGAQHDGTAFVGQALARGATALLLEYGVTLPSSVVSGAPIVRVPSVADGLAYGAAAVYGHPAFALDVVGVTGTNGKTTTTHLIRAAIDGALGAPYCGTIGTVGHTYAGKTIEASHTTPEADELARVLAVMKKRGATHVAMEVSSIALVAARVKAVRFRVGAFTNLTQDHLDYHGSMEAYAEAKLSLFTEAGPGLAVVNVGDPFGERVVAASRCKTLRVRPTVEGAAAEIFPERVVQTANGMEIVFRVPPGPGAPDGRVTIATRLVGAHNVENLAVALGVVASLELEMDRAAVALGRESGAPGRLERCDEAGDDIVVAVDYAHTPDALARVLEAVKPARGEGGRIVCVFGCGGDRDPTKRGPMGDAVGRGADVAIVTSDNPRTEDAAAIAAPVAEAVAAHLGRIAETAIAEGGRGHVVELDRKRAIALAIEGARAGDVVLVAGKGHEDYQIVGTTKHPFDDRVEARAALVRRRSIRR